MPSECRGPMLWPSDCASGLWYANLSYPPLCGLRDKSQHRGHRDTGEDTYALLRELCALCGELFKSYRQAGIRSILTLEGFPAHGLLSKLLHGIRGGHKNLRRLRCTALARLASSGAECRLR